MKKCLEAFDGTISANHDGKMSLEVLMNTVQKINIVKKQMLAESHILGDAIRVQPPPNELEDLPP
jgi:hypothetical protein